MKAMEQKNNIEIEYEDVDGNEQFIRLEMLTGTVFTVRQKNVWNLWTFYVRTAF